MAFSPVEIQRILVVVLFVSPEGTEQHWEQIGPGKEILWACEILGGTYWVLF